MSVLIRRVSPDDWPALRHIFLTARYLMLPQAAPGSFRLSDLDQQTQGETIWVAQADPENGEPEVVGFISMQADGNFIHHLMVDARAQGQGIGRLLLQHLPDWGRAPFYLKCLVSNSRAAAFYLNCGFLAVDAGLSADGEFTVFEIAPRV